MKELFVEKYRPIEFSDVIGLDENISKLIDDIPHLLFLGLPGTGKTTTAKIIIEKLNCDSLILNASSERGINVVREKIKSFAMTRSLNDKIKIIFLDEFDMMTNDAQTSLRNLMEEYHKNCRFIMTGNYSNKIIDPIKSRCMVFEFKLPPIEEILKRLKHICQVENININDDNLMFLIRKTYPDIRSAINKIQRYSKLDKEVQLSDLKKDKDLVDSFFKLIKEKEEFEKIRTFLLNEFVDYDDFLLEVHKYVLEHLTEWERTSQFNIIKAIAECNRYLGTCIIKEIEFENLIIILLEAK